MQTACDAKTSLELREFKKRQILRRKAYLEQAIATMRADALENAQIYTSDDRKDMNETVEHLKAELQEANAFAASGCASITYLEPASLTQKSAPLTPDSTSPEAASSNLPPNKNVEVIARAVRLASASPLTVVQNADAIPTPKADTAVGSAPQTAKETTPASKDDIQKLQDQMKEIRTALSTQNNDFGLVLGVGSLVINPHASDYKNDANVIHSTNLGSATPQLMTGVTFRSHIPSLTSRFRTLDLSCTPPQTPPKTSTKTGCGEPWQVHPWSGFVSLKFAPGASQVINGYVIGGTYSIAKYLDVLVGFALTPVNEASPGFRVTASQFVANQQKLGLDLNFDPNAMLSNKRNAFDGFPVTDPTGKLIYQGNPLSVHYRGGAVFGVSFPIYFRSFLKPATDANQR